MGAPVAEAAVLVTAVADGSVVGTTVPPGMVGADEAATGPAAAPGTCGFTLVADDWGSVAAA